MSELLVFEIGVDPVAVGLVASLVRLLLGLGLGEEGGQIAGDAVGAALHRACLGCHGTELYVPVDDAPGGGARFRIEVPS